MQDNYKNLALNGGAFHGHRAGQRAWQGCGVAPVGGMHLGGNHRAAVEIHRMLGLVRQMPVAGHHQPLRVWVLCLYFMGLNLSNRQIAQELGLNVSDVHAMTEQLRGGLVAKAPPVRLSGEVEIDEVYVVAGHKGQPAAVAKRGGLDAVADWRERRAAARWRRTSHPSSA